MNEQRIREIVREELAELKKSIQPVVVVIGAGFQITNADALTNERFSNQVYEAVSKSYRPKHPWGHS